MKRLLSSTALALALSVSAVAHAQTSGAQTQQPPAAQDQAAPSGAASSGAAGTITRQEAGEQMADHIIGAKVRNAQNESIGSVSDLLIDKDGQVKAAVLSVGGFLGIGDKKVAVPWDQLELRTEAASGSAGTAAASDPVVMVNMTKEQLQQAPAFRTAEEQRRESERTRTTPGGAPGTGTAPPAGGTSPAR